MTGRGFAFAHAKRPEDTGAAKPPRGSHQVFDYVDYVQWSVLQDWSTGIRVAACIRIVVVLWMIVSGLLARVP
jgi:hypothetical protein